MALLQWGRQRREGVWSEKVSLYEQDLQLCMTMVNTLKDFRAGAPGAGSGSGGAAEGLDFRYPVAYPSCSDLPVADRGRT